VDRDERDDVLVSALYGWERAPFLHEGLIMRPEEGPNVSMATFRVSLGAGTAGLGEE